MSIERVTVTCLLYGQVMQNVLNFLNPDGTTLPAAICTEIRNNWVGNATNIGIHSWVSSSVVWVGVSVQRLQAVPPAPTSLTFAQTGQQGGSDQMYPQLAVILKFATAIGGRRGRGRTYVPTVSGGFVTNGLINSTFHSYADTAIAGLNARFCDGGSGPLTLVVGPKVWHSDSDYNIVETITASNFTGTQRRRNIGFGV